MVIAVIPNAAICRNRYNKPRHSGPSPPATLTSSRGALGNSAQRTYLYGYSDNV